MDVPESNPRGEDEKRNHKSLINLLLDNSNLDLVTFPIERKKRMKATTLYLSRRWKTKVIKTLTPIRYL